ncbi:hypothetical protein CHS0354_001126 [Potamilus streckersoni]|uniref:PH domain-containing protein n=1 Tax=Potamilus streckersoni TaxID=2493646 RepID=A0AAE0SZN1_9BIVA|nr:hypothetical protein CHS0354_001126 [Potamilus streckersoni]
MGCGVSGPHGNMFIPHAPVCKVGYLLHCTSKNQKWKRVFCVLYRDTVLAWYKQQGDGQPEDHISLQEVCSFLLVGPVVRRISNCPKLPPHPSLSYDYMIAVPETPSVHANVHWFLCSDGNAMGQWLKALADTLPPPHSPHNQGQGHFPSRAPSQQPPPYGFIIPPPHGSGPSNNNHHMVHSAGQPSHNVMMVHNHHHQRGSSGDGRFMQGLLVGGALGFGYGHPWGWGWGWGWGYHPSYGWGYGDYDQDIYIHNEYNTEINNYGGGESMVDGYQGDYGNNMDTPGYQADYGNSIDPPSYNDISSGGQYDGGGGYNIVDSGGGFGGGFGSNGGGFDGGFNSGGGFSGGGGFDGGFNSGGGFDSGGGGGFDSGGGFSGGDY